MASQSKDKFVKNAAYTIISIAADYSKIEAAKGCSYEDSLIFAVKHLLEEEAWKDCKEIKQEVTDYYSSRGVNVELKVSSPPQKAGTPLHSQASVFVV